MATRIDLSHATLELDDVGEGHPTILLHGFPATRYLWSQVVPPLAKVLAELLGARLARMEQAFSADGGKTWEVNWICELVGLAVRGPCPSPQPGRSQVAT